MKDIFQPGSLTALLVLSALVIGSPPAKADINTIRNSDNAVWGSIGGYLFDYKESAPPPDLPDSERDWIDSGAAGITFLRPGNIYMALEGAYSQGNAHYNGAYFYFPTTPLEGTTKEKVSTVDGRLGKGFVLGNSIMFIPYAELGYRYWDRNLGGGQEENYQNFDALAGAMLQASPFQSVILSIYGSGGTTVSPEMKTGGYTYDLGTDTMYKLGGKIGYDLTQRVELFTTVDYDHFRYGQSPVVNSAYEPNSNTDETAVRVGLAYHFN